MRALAAVRCDPHLKAFYELLLDRRYVYCKLIAKFPEPYRIVVGCFAFLLSD
jgi:hypothetical protein